LADFRFKRERTKEEVVLSIFGERAPFDLTTLIFHTTTATQSNGSSSGNVEPTAKTSDWIQEAVFAQSKE
jgi:hypothetical protein